MTSDDNEHPDVRRNGRLHAAQRSVWIMCCLLTLFIVTRTGNRYLSNRRLMRLAESCNSERVDVSLGWKDPGYDTLAQWMGQQTILAFTGRPVSLIVQGQDPSGADASVLQLIQSSSGLEDVFIHNRDIPNGVLEQIAIRHRVKTLQFRIPVIRADDAAWLSRMTSLKHVVIGQFVHEPRQNDWSWLKSLPHLEKLEVTLWGPSEADIAALADCAATENLSLSGQSMSDESLVRLCGLPALKYLDLQGPSQLHFPSGKKFPETLATLDLRSSVSDDASLAAIADLPFVTRVSITGGNVTDVGAKVLAKLPSLTQLWLDNLSQLTDEGLKTLSESTSLTEIHVIRCGTTPAGLVHLNETPNWTEIRFEGVTFRRQPGDAKLALTPASVESELERQRERNQIELEIINGPVRSL